MKVWTMKEYEALSLNYRLTVNMMSVEDQETMCNKLNMIYSDIKRNEVIRKLKSGDGIDTQSFLSLLGWFGVDYLKDGLWIQQEVEVVYISGYLGYKLNKTKKEKLSNLVKQLIEKV